MNTLASLYQKSETPAQYVKGFCEHMAEMVRRLDADATAEVINAIERACLEDKTIFLVANGGSAAVATHCVNDLSANSVIEGAPGFRVMSLTDNASSVTAIANDASFEEVFSIQLRANMRQGDLVIFMSVSGNSPNLVRAAEYANANGGHTMCFVGFDGGKLKELCGHCVHIPSTKDEYGPVEDMFSVILHVASGYLTMKRGRKLQH